MKNKLFNFFYLFIFFTSHTYADIKVYVSHKSPIEKISKQELVNLYLKKTTLLDGKRVYVLDNQNEYDDFSLKVLDKTQNQLHAYWMKEIFLGQNIPPKRIKQQDILKYLQENKFTIVYSVEPIDAKVIYEH